MKDERFPHAPDQLVRRIKKHIIAQEHEFFAIVPPGFEATAMREFGHHFPLVEAVFDRGGFSWKGRLNDLYLASLSLHIPVRILMRIKTFRAERKDLLQKKLDTIPWELYLPESVSLSVSASSKKSRLIHTGLMEEAVRNSISQKNIEISDSGHKHTIFIRFIHDHATVSIDTSGAPLYQRKMRTLVEDAPLRENIAAAVLLEGGIENADLLLDPMCGSGVFSIEGALLSSGTFPGLRREYAFMSFPFFSPGAYNSLNKNQGSDPLDIIAGDVDTKSLESAKRNIEQAGFKKNITIENHNFFSHRYEVPAKTLVVINPPYGKRIAADKEFYIRLKETLTAWYSSSSWALVLPKHGGASFIKMPGVQNISFQNGGIDTVLVVKKG